MDLTRLAEPFAPEDVEWRIQRNGVSNGKPWAMVLAYITNRAIMERLDSICGAENWQNEYKEWHGTSQLCGISILINKSNPEWVTKWDGADATNIESTKGGLSDSMKRAGVQWGIGRYLYRLDATFVDLIDGRSKDKDCINVFVDKKNMHFKIPTLPDFAKPTSKDKEDKTPVTQQLAEKLARESMTEAPTSPRKEVANPGAELLAKKNEIRELYKATGDTRPITDFLIETIGVSKIDIIEDANTVLEALKK